MDSVAGSWLLPAVLSGLAGAGHCALMCAAPMGAVLGARFATPGAPGGAGVIAIHPSGAQAIAQSSSSWSLSIGAQLGRVTSYAMAGLAAGSLGSVVTSIPASSQALLVADLLALLAQGIVLLTGLYLLGFVALLRPLESAPRLLWRHLGPLARKLVPVETVAGAFAFGALWGWIPCGLSYAMLLVAFGSANPGVGLAVMAAFGLGTLPVMIAGGRLAGAVASRMKAPVARRVAGVLILGLAIVGLARIAGGPTLKPLLTQCRAVLGLP